MVALLPPSYQLEDVLKRQGFEGQDLWCAIIPSLHHWRALLPSTIWCTGNIALDIPPMSCHNTYGDNASQGDAQPC
jgi:hypothetical protein